MPHDEGSLAATTAIIRTLARGDPTSHLDVSRLGIPGANSPEKRALERELVTLINRVRYLEAKAAAVQPHPTLPETPSEHPAPLSPLSSSVSSPCRSPPVIENGTKGEFTNGSGEKNGDGTKPMAEDSAGHIAFLDKVVKSQQEQLQIHGKIVDSIQDEVLLKTTDTLHVVAETSDRVEKLQRELKKSQQANEAFSKALREIGAIVTAGMNPLVNFE